MSYQNISRASVERAEPLEFPDRKPARQDLTITVKATIDGFPVELCYTGGIDQLLHVTKRLRELGAEPVSAPPTAAPPARKPARRVQPAYDGDPSMPALVSFVVSLNLKRRHLTSSQRAVVALEIERILGEAARERMTAGINQHTPVQRIEQGTGRASEQAAATIGTNRQYVIDAKKLADEAPDLLEEVRSGALTIPEAKREIKEREREQARQARPAGLRRRRAADLPCSPQAAEGW